MLLLRGLPAVALRSAAPATQPDFVVIDTGSNDPMVTESFARQRGFHIYQWDMKNTDAFGNTRTFSHIAHVTSLQIGDATLEDYEAHSVDFPLFRDFGPHLVGVLGAQTFDDVLATFDYPNRRMILTPGGSLPEPNGKDILPLKLTPAGHMLIPMTIMGRETWLVLDTGYTGAGPLLSRYRLIGTQWLIMPIEGPVERGYLSSKRVRIGRMNGKITLGQYEFANPILAVSSDDDFESIGYYILRHFAVTIDRKHGRVRFASADRYFSDLR